MASKTLVNRLKVFVDGIEVRECIGFNISDGWADFFATSPSKYHNIDAEVGDFLYSRLHGYIEIEEEK